MIQSRQSVFFTVSPFGTRGRGHVYKAFPKCRPCCDGQVPRQSLRPVRRDAMRERQQKRAEKLRVLGLISACVESNVSVPSRQLLHRFQRAEKMAGLVFSSFIFLIVV